MEQPEFAACGLDRQRIVAGRVGDQEILGGAIEFRAVDLSDVFSLVHRGTGVINEQLFELALGPDCNIVQARLVIDQPAKKPALELNGSVFDRGGLDLHERGGTVTDPEHRQVVIHAIVHRDRDEIHAADRTLAELGLPDLGVHGARMNGGTLAGFGGGRGVAVRSTAPRGEQHEGQDGQREGGHQKSGLHG